MLNIGDVAVYPSHGLATVEGIKSSDISGKSVDFYVLKIISSGATLMVPVTGSQSLRLRRPLNQDELQDTFAVLSSAAKLPQKAWNRRFKEYNDKIRRGAVLDVASVLRDLWAMKHAKTLSYGEKHLLEKAWELMESELLLAYQYDKPRIKGLLEEALERQFEGISIALPH